MSQLTQQLSNGTTNTQTAITAGTADLGAGAPSIPANASRKVVEVYNNGAVPIYVSAQNLYATAVATGRPIAAGQAWTDTASSGAWFLFAASGTADVRVTTVLP